MIDEISLSDPDRPFISIPKSELLIQGYSDVSYRQFAKAVNRCSWWIKETIGQGIKGDSKTVFYLGPLDIRYLIILLGAVKTGHVVSY